MSIHESTETMFAVHPVLMKRYVTGNEAFLTHSRTHRELRLFFFFVSESFISL